MEGNVSLAHFRPRDLSLSTCLLFLTPTLVRRPSQHEAEAIRLASVHEYSLGYLGKERASQNGRAIDPGESQGHRSLSASGRGISPVAFSGLLHMKHCHAPAASLKPNTSKNLTSSR